MSETPARSTFVTRLGWSLVVFFAFSALIGVVQNVMVNVMISGEQWQQQLDQLSFQGNVPNWLMPLLNNFRWLVFSVLLFSVFSLAASIALLRRREWGRRAVMVVLVMGVLFTIGGLWWQYDFLEHIRTTYVSLPQQSLDSMTLLNVVNSIFALLTLLLHGWLLKKLCSAKIVAEFQPSLDHSEIASQ